MVVHQWLEGRAEFGGVRSLDDREYFTHEVTNVGVVQRSHLHAVTDVVHHWQDVTTAQQVNHVLHQTLL